MSGGCLDGVCGCPTVSGSYLGVSGRHLGEYRWHINHIEVVISSYCLFSQWPPIGQNWRKIQKVNWHEDMSFQYICIPPLYKLSWICVLGCLKGAWRVSGGVWKVSGGVCKVSARLLGETGTCLGSINAKSIDKNQFWAIVSIFCLFSQCPIIGKITKNVQNFQTPGTGVKTKVLMKTEICPRFYI